MNKYKEHLQNAINKIMAKKCPYCGADLQRYPFYRNDGTRFAICKGCGHAYEFDRR